MIDIFSKSLFTKKASKLYRNFINYIIICLFITLFFLFYRSEAKVLTNRNVLTFHLETRKYNKNIIHMDDFYTLFKYVENIFKN